MEMLKKIKGFFTAASELKAEKQLNANYRQHVRVLNEELNTQTLGIAELQEQLKKLRAARLHDNQGFGELQKQLKKLEEENAALKRERLGRVIEPRGRDSRSARKLKQELHSLRRRSDVFISMEGVFRDAAKIQDAFMNNPTAPNRYACIDKGNQLLEILHRKGMHKK